MSAAKSEHAASCDHDSGEPVVRGALDGVKAGLPCWQLAHRLQERAADAGFAWPDVGPVLDKLGEELAEVREAVGSGCDREHIEEEIGDMLFVLVNLCRHTGTDFASALDRANTKFQFRFRHMEQHAAKECRGLRSFSAAQLRDLWDQAKAAE